MKITRLFRVLVLLGLAAALAGCYSVRAADIQAFTKPYQVVVNADNYYLKPPDEIELNSERVPEVHEDRQQIRPDGRVMFEGLGEFMVAGKTPAEVAKMIEQKAAEVYTLPGDFPIAVKVRTYASSMYYVVGEVSTPGSKPYTGRDTVLRALAESGLLVTAWRDQILVVRPAKEPDAKPHKIKVNWQKMVEKGDMTKNVMLEEGDIVYVPPTVLAAIANVIAEFARPIGQALAPAVQVSQIAYQY